MNRFGCTTAVRTSVGSARSPLTGIRVLELTIAIQGPACCQIMADMGADVVKVEPIAGEANRGAAGKPGTDSAGKSTMPLLEELSKEGLGTNCTVAPGQTSTEANLMAGGVKLARDIGRRLPTAADKLRAGCWQMPGSCWHFAPSYWQQFVSTGCCSKEK